MTKILITSALPYINNVPHLGHIVGCHLPADIFYRFQKSLGNDATFIGGADEHGTATLISARELGISPEELCSKLGKMHKEMYDKLGISYSLFSGTHTKYNEEATLEFYHELEKNGYYKDYNYYLVNPIKIEKILVYSSENTIRNKFEKFVYLI